MASTTQSSNASSHGVETNYSEAEPWIAASRDYTEHVGPSTAEAAPHMVALASSILPLTSDTSNILELGAGTGSLTFAIAAAAPETPLLATDISPEMLAQLTSNAAKAGISNVPRTQVLDMTAVELPKADFSHIFCFMAIQNLSDPLPSVRHWINLLKPGGVLAIGIWDIDKPIGPYDIWFKTASKVLTKPVNRSMLPPGAWKGSKGLENGLREAGLHNLKLQSYEVGFNIGKEAFMKFFWEGQNPMPVECRKGRSEEETEKLKLGMLEVLRDEYEDGNDVPLWIGLAVGVKGAL